jgi:predicted nucleic acid-binding protein
MKIFLDTNVLVSAVIKQHVFHERAFVVFESVLDGKREGTVSSHSLAEMYSVLTKLPPPYRHTPEQALLSIEENVLKHFQIISLSGRDYAAVLREAALAGIQGGSIYDALLLRCAVASGADRIYTLNLKHFQSLAGPEIVKKLSEP